MAGQKIFSVRPVEKQGRKLIVGRPINLPSAADAIACASWDAWRFIGVLATEQTIDPATGEALQNPVIIARHGVLPAELETA